MANEETRKKILDTALKLFSDKGFEAVGVQEIAQECNLTKPSLYYYFNSKSGILEGIMTEYVDPFIADLKKSISNDEGIESSLKNFAYCYISNCCRNLPLCMMMMTMQYSPVHSEYNKAFVKHCRVIIELAINLFLRESHMLGNMNGREGQFANTFLGILGFHMYTLRLSENPQLDKNEVDNLIHQFLHGIFS